MSGKKEQKDQTRRGNSFTRAEVKVVKEVLEGHTGLLSQEEEGALNTAKKKFQKMHDSFPAPVGAGA